MEQIEYPLKKVNLKDQSLFTSFLSILFLSLFLSLPSLPSSATPSADDLLALNDSPMSLTTISTKTLDMEALRKDSILTLTVLNIAVSLKNWEVLELVTLDLATYPEAWTDAQALMQTILNKSLLNVDILKKLIPLLGTESAWEKNVNVRIALTGELTRKGEPRLAQWYRNQFSSKETCNSVLLRRGGDEMDWGSLPFSLSY